jgi:hypothetical protein
MRRPAYTKLNTVKKISGIIEEPFQKILFKVELKYSLLNAKFYFHHFQIFTSNAPEEVATPLNIPEVLNGIV